MFLLLALICIPAYPLADTTPPQWRNQKQSKELISQGEYVSLQAEGKDSVSLHKTVLSTNETGVWKNLTEHAFLWKQDRVSGFDNFGTATYEDGILYAPSKADARAYAINASNGDVIWNSTVRECDASPRIDGDVVYVGECSHPGGEPIPDPKAIALNRTNGKEIWHYVEPHGNEWVGSPIVHGDYVYYTTLGSGIYALNKTNGNIIWQQDIGFIVCSAAYHEGTVFISGSNLTDPQGQYAFNATNGEIIWHVNYGAPWDSSPVIYNGMVIQVTRDVNTRIWTTYVLNETNGQLIQEFDDKGSPSTPLVHDDKIFIPDDDWKIWAFDLKTGEELWHTVDLHNGSLQDFSYCTPALAGGAVYYQSLNGTFYVINETDGSVLWSYALGGYGFGSPSIGDGNVFITNDAALYAFRIGPGSGNWTMFCQNELHRTYSERGIEYVRWPLTQPNYFNNVSDVWKTAKFVWCNKTIRSAAIQWRIYFYDGAGNVAATDTKVFYVTPAPVFIRVPDDYPTIQGAINAAIPGDTIYVHNGTYHENVVVNKTVSLIGENKSNTIIDGGGMGIVVNVTSNNVVITKFTVRNSGHYFPNSGICVFHSNRTNITGNTMKSSCYGILLYYSNNNTVTGNTMINNSGHGIVLHVSDDNTISANNLTNNDSEAINLFRSDRNRVQDNDIVNNKRGIWMDESTHNIFVNNNIEKEIGIADSKYNSFVGNNITDGGLALHSCDDNNIIENNVINNEYGVFLASSNGNHICHNNFINNTYQAYVFEEFFNNTWDDGYPSGGNYWSDYNGTDLFSGPNQNETGNDGIGDTQYALDAYTIDNFPLMAPINIFNAGTWNGVSYNVDVISNSTVSNFYFNPEEGAFLRFNVTGEHGTTGFCRVTIPQDLLWVEDGWTVLVGGDPVEYTVIPDKNFTFLYLTYNRTTKTVLIQGTHVIPEFPVAITMPLLIFATLLVAIFRKRMRVPKKIR